MINFKRACIYIKTQSKCVFQSRRCSTSTDCACSWSAVLCCSLTFSSESNTVIILLTYAFSSEDLLIHSLYCVFVWGLTLCCMNAILERNKSAVGRSVNSEHERLRHIWTVPGCYVAAPLTLFGHSILRVGFCLIFSFFFFFLRKISGF